MLIKFYRWIVRIFQPDLVPPTIPPPYVPAPEVFRDQAGPIGPDIIITNHRKETVILEGVVISRLVLKPGESRTVKSPIVEPYRDGGNLRVRQWDAAFVVNDMIKNWMLGILYDEVPLRWRGDRFDLRAEMKLDRRVNVCGVEVQNLPVNLA